MIFRTLIVVLFTSIFIVNEGTAQRKKPIESENLHRRFEEDKKKEQEESLKRQPASVIDIPKVTFLLPGFFYEKAIGLFQTLQAYAFYNLNAYTRSSGGMTDSKYYFDPTILLTYRYYYNHDRRTNVGKVTERNTMNYIGPYAQVFLSKIPLGNNAYESDKRRLLYSYGVLYGLQRNYNSHFSLDLNFGLGIISGESSYYNSNRATIVKGNQNQLTIPGQITLGFWLGQK